MPWPNPRTRASGELVTAAMMNEQIRDTFAALGVSVAEAGRAMESFAAALATNFAGLPLSATEGERRSDLAEIECPSVRKKRTILLED